ncbi:MAG: NAD(P)H-dependent oxidoreductase subunit E [Eubacteriales bacterium]|nr:NAD(P)H-dependent oxidoreductase subunit E [Eubacteriales bacterium]
MNTGFTDANPEEELRFREELEILVDSFGTENQDGVKEALRTCQEWFGCIAKSHQAQIADAFAVPLNTIKIFMKLNKSLKESIVEYDIICCTGGRCSKNGSLAVLTAISKELGISHNEITPDGKIHFRTQNCFKQCNLGPNVMVNGKFYHAMDAKRAQALI